MISFLGEHGKVAQDPVSFPNEKVDRNYNVAEKAYEEMQG